MSTTREKVNIREFAGRVERLLDFFITKYEDEFGRDGSEDLLELERLKEEAANIQFRNKAETVIDGLHDFMNGL